MTHEEILKLFVSDDEIRESIMKPNRVGDYVYATTGTDMLIVPGHLVSEPFSPHPKAPNFQAVIPEESMRIAIPVAAIREAMSGVEKTPAYEECEMCGGFGEVECPHCGIISDCKACDGTGQSESVVGYAYKFGQVAEFIEGVYVGCDIVERMLAVCELERCETVTLLAGAEKKAHLFEVGRCRVLAMPRLSSASNELIEIVKIPVHA